MFPDVFIEPNRSMSELENIQETRWVRKRCGLGPLPPSARKTIDLEGKTVDDGGRKDKVDKSRSLL
jgi:hypothetical protein